MTGSTITKYYFAGTQRIATPALAPGASVRKYTIPQSMTVEYMLGDHLGSTSITTDSTGAKVSEMRYKPWGEVRYSWTAGLSTTPAYKLNSYTFTGQYSYMDDPSTTGVTEGFGLMFYNARMYDPAIARFTSADTIVPGGVQGLDRYAYTNNNPVRYTDPSGHTSCEGPNGAECDRSYSTPSSIGQLRSKLRSYGVKLTGNWKNHVNEQWAVYFGVEAVGLRLAESGFGASASDAFKNVYGAVHFQWGCGDDCRSKDKNGKPYGDEGGAFASGWQANNGDGYFLIKFGTMLDDGGIRGVRQTIHELGHTYDYAMGDISDTMPDNVYTRDSLRPNGYSYNGIFYEQDDVLLWQMHPLSMTNGDSRGETFADIFVAWTLDAWNTNPYYADAVQSAQDWMP